MPHRMWALWVFGGLAVWCVVAFLVAVVVGRGVSLADRRAAGTASAGELTALEPAVSAAPARARQPRRAIPLPPIGMALAAVAVALETCGFVLRLHGSRAGVLSMDGPLALPRMLIVAIFATAAIAAISAAIAAISAAGAGPHRRAWWTTVGLVAAGIATVKAGGTFHRAAREALSAIVGSAAANVISGLLALAVIAVLWTLSRNDRRDRRRVLGSLAGYAVAAVAISAVSSALSGTPAVVSTYIEESGEALGGVAFLIAVLAGVAPRLVLPAGWPLRRAADAQTLDAPQPLRSPQPR